MSYCDSGRVPVIPAPPLKSKRRKGMAQMMGGAGPMSFFVRNCTAHGLPTEELSRRELLTAYVERAAERHKERSDAERRNEGFPSIYGKRAAERHELRSDAERWNEGFPSIYGKRAAERHELRSDAERWNEGFPSIYGKRTAERHELRSDAKRWNEGFPSW